MDDKFPIHEILPNDFPPLLREINDPPKKLFARGAVDPSLWVDRSLLAVVGSRKYSTYGKEVTRSLIAGLKSYPITIVSGLAIGIDAIAHESALESGLLTISVPGSGLSDKVLHPRTNRVLARRILEAGGALISEYEPDFVATVWSFPQRNRIMAGMSHATLIIEAGEKSGTLITARLAMEYNRDVLTVPGSIFASGSIGPHKLIRDGATPITESGDILEALHLKTHEETPLQIPLDVTEDELTLLTLLETDMLKDELIRACARPAHETNILITMLELKGYIQEHGGKIMRTVRL